MTVTQTTPILCWFRNDLRLKDNSMIAAALSTKQPILFVYIFDQNADKEFPIGAASKWWLHHSLTSLKESLQNRKADLIVRIGDTESELLKICKQTECTTVFWNRRYEPHHIQFDTELKKSLTQHGLNIKSFSGNLLIEPWDFQNKQGKPYQVFTPFWKTLKYLPLGQTQSSEATQYLNLPIKPSSVSIDHLNLLPKLNWDADFSKNWNPGEKSAWMRFMEFIEDESIQYDDLRNIPSTPGTSRLSPHLHFGEISPNTIWKECFKIINRSKNITRNKHLESFLREIAWREFSSHLLYHFPSTSHAPLHKQFDCFPWLKNKTNLRKWQQGLTGFPIIDAGLRELWKTGWMHNRVRMIVASFLVKNLMIHWHEGRDWFWDTLVDADLANNSLGWQWVTGCGADAAPYYRIFNPILQGEKFDPEGLYVKTWVPELKFLDKKWIHKPFEAPEHHLAKLNIALGKTYPKPLVSLAETRDRALSAYKNLKGKI